jgi:hypothetical protein
MKVEVEGEVDSPGVMYETKDDGQEGERVVEIW